MLPAELGAALASQIAPGALPAQLPCSRELRDGTLLISGSKTQTETLDALLTATSALTPACGLLILRGTQASGWNCMNLGTVDNFKRTVLDCSQGVAGAVVNSCAGRSARISELDPAFRAQLGLESSAKVLLLPVLLKERVAALLLAVSGPGDGTGGIGSAGAGCAVVAGSSVLPQGRAAGRLASRAPGCNAQPLGSGCGHDGCGIDARSIAFGAWIRGLCVRPSRLRRRLP